MKTAEPKVDLKRSLIIVACLWVALGLLVTVNIAINGVDRFYGPTGYCEFCLIAFS